MAAAAALLALALPAAAQPLAPSTAPVIGEIRIQRVNVFDPAVKGEGIWIFRMANRIHFVTKDRVVRREVLLAPGGRWDPLKALESERNLRVYGSFRRAEIRAVPGPRGTLDLDVFTQDSWTTNIQLSAGTEGGDSFFIWGLEENNLLGHGKSVGYLHSQIGPKIRNDLRYTDPRLLGSRWRLSTLYATTPKGDSIGADVTRPFYSLDTPGAAGVGWTRFIDEDVLYRDADELSRFLERSQSVQLSAGARLDTGQGDFVHRGEMGWWSEKHQFTSSDGTRTGTLPAYRELSGPTAGWSWVQPRYIKETYIHKMERVEDFNLGNELRFLGGFMGRSLGSDRDRWIYNASDQQGLGLGPGRFVLAQVGVSGRIAQGRPDNTLLFANLNLHWKTSWPLPQTWVAHLEGVSSRSLDAENQVILGGDTGLRGYRNNAFTGGRAVLFNAENRVFFPGEYLHLIRLGAAVFFDSGAVVPEGSGFSFRRFYSDVGAGLRVSSTRSRSGGVGRLDVAYALNKGPGPDRIVVSIRGSQAFDLFLNSAKRVKQSPSSRVNEIAPPVFPSVR